MCNYFYPQFIRYHNFNTKMFKETPYPTLTFNHKQNWMDQRVLTIMKKYEKPHQTTHKDKHTHTRHDYSPTPNWKAHSPYTEHPNHKDSDDYSYRADRKRSYKEENNFSNYTNKTDSIKREQVSAFKPREKRMYTENEQKNMDQGYRFQHKNMYERGNLNQISINNITKESSNSKYGYQEESYAKYNDDRKNDRFGRYEPSYEESYSKSPYHFKNDIPRTKPEDNWPTDKSCILNAKSTYVPRRESNKVYTQTPQINSFKDEVNTSYMRYQKPAFEQIEYDKRISNIQRINNKIKQILGTKEDAHDAAESVIFRNNIAKSLTPQKNEKNEVSLERTKSPLERTKSRINKEQKQQKQLQRTENQRSKSCIGNKSKIQKENPAEADDQKFKKIQDQINSFNKRVALLAEEKKKLNIELPCSVASQLKETSQAKEKTTQKHREKEKSSTKQQVPLAEKAPSKNFNKKSLNNLVTVQSVHSLHDEQKPKDLYELEQKSQKRVSKRKQNAYSDNGIYSNIKSQTEVFSESQFYESSQEIQVEENQSTSETKMLLHQLSEQVKLDEQFRITKNWFVYSDIHNQYEVLQSILGQRWREMSLEEIQAQFSVNFQEDDPFYSYRPDQYVLEDMVNNYIICSKHWKEMIEHKWNSLNYIKEGLLDRLDIQNKGSISIEDLVRVLNMQEGVFYRNRDLYMVYQRLLRCEYREGENLSIEVFNSILSKN